MGTYAPNLKIFKLDRTLFQMGKLKFSISDEVETRFRNSFVSPKKGDMSKKIEELIVKDLDSEAKFQKKDLKIVDKIFSEGDKLISKFYESENFSLAASNIAALEWDKAKQRIRKLFKIQ